MVRLFLISRPRHDVITSYLNFFAEEPINRFKKEIHVTDLDAKEANRKNLEKYAGAQKFIFLNGHGDENSVCGHKDEVIFDENNLHLCKEKLVYALACNSLGDLGRKAVEIGATAYIGFSEKYMLIVDPSRTSTPAKDGNAAPFKQTYQVLLNEILNGEKLEDAIKKAKDEHLSLIRTLGTSKDDPYGDINLVRFALTWNMDSLGILGNKKAAF